MTRSAISPRLATRILVYIRYLLVSTLNSGLPNSTASSFSTSTETIVPEISAGISLNTFIASTMQITCPFLTTSPGATIGRWKSPWKI